MRPGGASFSGGCEGHAGCPRAPPSGRDTPLWLPGCHAHLTLPTWLPAHPPGRRGAPASTPREGGRRASFPERQRPVSALSLMGRDVFVSPRVGRPPLALRAQAGMLLRLRIPPHSDAARNHTSRTRPPTLARPEGRPARRHAPRDSCHPPVQRNGRVTRRHASRGVTRSPPPPFPDRSNHPAIHSQ